MKFRFFILCFLFVLLFLGSVSAGENDTIEYDDFDWSDYGDYDDLVNEDAVDDDFDENDFNINDNDINLNESYDNDDPNPRSDIATTITASSITKYYRDGTQVYAYLKKSNGSPLAGKLVKVLFCGKTYNRTTNANGRVGLDITALPNTYTVKFSFSEQGYVSSSKTVTVTVNTMPTTITGSDITKFYKDGTLMYAYLKDRNNNPLVGKHVKVLFWGKTYNRTTDSNGRVSLDVTALPNTYNVKCSFDEAGYASSSKTIKVTVNTMPTTITAESLSFIYGEEQPYLEAYLKDRNNNPLSNMQVKIDFTGRIYNRTTDSNGCARLQITSTPRTVNTRIFFTQDGYVSSEKYVTINIQRIPANLTVNSISCCLGDDSYLYSYVVDKYGNKLSNIPVDYTFNGIQSTVLTDNNGRADFKIPDVNTGTYNAEVCFNHNLYQQITKNVNVVVNPANASLTVSNLICDYDNITYWHAYLTDMNNMPLSNKNITFNINDEIYCATTNSSGCARLLINQLPGFYNVKVSYFKSPYSSLNKHVNLTVLSDRPTVNYTGGFYNQSYLNLKISLNNDSLIRYSWDNETWNETNSTISFKLFNGIYDLFYGGSNLNVSYAEHYVIDNKIPYVWSNHQSDIYTDPFYVNLTSIDNLDNDPMIFYTTDGTDPYSNGILYTQPIYISNTTTLKFYSIDYNGHKSSISICNYVYAKVGNLNSGKGFDTIQSAIDDADTGDGDYIRVSDGFYPEQITVNKSLNLIGNSNGSVILKGFNSTRPVIGISTNGSNSLIYGFNIVNSTFGAVVYGTENVTLSNNYFTNLLYSIDTDYDKNTLIYNNHISSDTNIANITGILVRNSLNSDIIYNDITINSNQYPIGIMLNSGRASNIRIKNNNITNLNVNQGAGLLTLNSNLIVENNTISNFYSGIYSMSYNSLINNNILHDNVVGLYIELSVNNTYKSNNIFNNYCGVFLSSHTLTRNDSFYLNRICNNEFYDLYSISNYSFIINDNWWGANTPAVTINDYVLANVYNGTGNLVMDSWVVMNIFSSSFNVDENSNLLKAKFSLDMTYNNLNQKLSYKGFLPDGLETRILCFNDGGLISNVSYLKDGVAFVYYDLEDLFISEDAVYVKSYFDNDNIGGHINKNVNISISLFSSAFVENTFNFANFNLEIPYSNVSWITFSWGETGLYTGVINVIVDGVIVESINVTNRFYQAKKDDYGVNVFEAMKFYNNFYASMKEGVWEPNGYYLQFASLINASYTDYELIHTRFLNYIQLYYDLTDGEVTFIDTHHNYFVDMIDVAVNYHGDLTPTIRFEYDGESKLFNPPSSYAHRVSNFYYTDILDENSVSIGYEGMRSFCVAKDVVSDDVLSYYLSQKDLYNPGLMKAAYGTFLSSLLVIYEHDRVAEMAGNTFNVTWSRVSPVCVSLCNDYNCLYITGESDHRMGLEATGNSSDVWRFHFATSFSFSLVEQLVGNNIWNTTQIGSVTLGLFESYLNNETLELFYSNGYLFLKRENDNSALLFLDMDTGIVRDIFNNYGLLGTMPCYHDNKTDNTLNYGYNLLNLSSFENKQLGVIFGACFSSSFFLEAGIFLGELSLGAVGSLVVIFIPILIVLFPDEANAWWLEFAYLLNPEARDYPDIPIYEGTDLNIYRLFYNHNPVIINPEDEKLYDYYTTIVYKQIIRDPKTQKNYDNKLKNERDRDFKIKIVAGGPDDPDHDNITIRSNKVGEYIKEFKDEFISAEGINKFFVLKDNLLKIITIGIFIFSEKTIFDIIFYSIVTYFIGNDNSTNSTAGP